MSGRLAGWGASSSRSKPQPLQIREDGAGVAVVGLKEVCYVNIAAKLYVAFVVDISTNYITNCLKRSQRVWQGVGVATLVRPL